MRVGLHILKLLSVVGLLLFTFITNAQVNTITTKKSDVDKRERSKLSYSTSAYSYRGLDELSETGFGVSLGASYAFSSNFISSIGTSYNVPEDLKDSNPEYYGWEDISIKFVVPTVAKSPTVDNMSFSVGLKAPTSKVSRITTLITAVSPSTTLRKSFEIAAGKLTVAYSLGLNIAHYKYDSSVFGGAYSPFGVSNGFSFSLQPSDRWSVSTSASFYNRTDYDKNWDLIQTLTMSTSYRISRALSASVSYRWRDKYYSNDSFLDDDKSLVSLSIGYNF